MARSLSSWVPSDDKCSPELLLLLLRRLHDNGESTGFQALSQYHSFLQWFSTQFVSIFYSIGQDSRSGCPFLPLIQSVKLSSARHILLWGLPKETVPSLVGGTVSCAAQAVSSRASVCPLWACHSDEASQLPGSGWVKQHLSSKRTTIVLRGGWQQPPPPPLPIPPHTRRSTPHLSQNNRKDSGESLGLNLTRARRMRKRSWHHC